MMRRLLIALLVLGLLAPLTACGRKGSLEPPPGSTYPREYPAE
ncbi:LPS translocon maturation chaperone LptM [Shumkonia mesophila]|nr:lipoprotein [Shumkonia mesophila]